MTRIHIKDTHKMTSIHIKDTQNDQHSHKRHILNDYHSHNFNTHTERLAFTRKDKPLFVNVMGKKLLQPKYQYL
jgi:hypothetical protein